MRSKICWPIPFLLLFLLTTIQAADKDSLPLFAGGMALETCAGVDRGEFWPAQTCPASPRWTGGIHCGHRGGGPAIPVSGANGPGIYPGVGD